MLRNEILDDLETLQDEAYEQGFMGSNERELFLRESIADYILSKLHQPTISGQLPLDFVKWYSGMEEEKILKAYERWKNETFKSEKL